MLIDHEAPTRSALQEGWVEACAAVIFGGGCARQSGLEFLEQQLQFGLGLRVARELSSHPSVVGTCTSIICTAENFSSTLRA